MIERVLEEMPAQPVTHFDDLFAADAEARERSEEPGPGVDASMSWFCVFLGFCLLIILHEAGHFVAAKATGMRVERFFLFFGPTIWSFKRGETEYGVKSIPLGGYVKITGMNPEEEVPPEHEDARLLPAAGLEADRRRRGGAGGEHRPRLRDPLRRLLGQRPPRGRPGGRRGERRNARRRRCCSRATGSSRSTAIGFPGLDLEERLERFGEAVGSHECAGKQIDGCVAATPVKLEVERDGATKTFSVYPRYDKEAERALVGFSYGSRIGSTSAPARAASRAGDSIWEVASGTVHVFTHLFESEQRKQVSGVVGISDVGHQVIERRRSNARCCCWPWSASRWASSTCCRSCRSTAATSSGRWSRSCAARPVSLRVMERATMVGFALVLMLFFLGLSNDIGRITGEGFNVR